MGIDRDCFRTVEWNGSSREGGLCADVDLMETPIASDENQINALPMRRCRVAPGAMNRLILAFGHHGHTWLRYVRGATCTGVHGLVFCAFEQSQEI